ncbi:hypothetical protein RIF29_34257 [Crotalaria pallida]|uniref:Uncharacterized protein n=1 Tax=Crotalaria pallida TaxID=3830 RepID=A0AAN9E911_CROPI
MTKKRGRPPKSPLVNSKNSSSNHKDLPIDFDALDDLNIDALSPKKQSQLLTLLDEIRTWITGKASVDESDATVQGSNKGKGPQTQNHVDLTDTQNKDSTGKETEGTQ